MVTRTNRSSSSRSSGLSASSSAKRAAYSPATASYAARICSRDCTSGSEALQRPFLGFPHLFLARARRRVGRERVHEPVGGFGDLVNGLVEHGFVGARRLGGSA